MAKHRPTMPHASCLAAFLALLAAATAFGAVNPLANPVAPAVEVGPEIKPVLSQYRIFVESVTFNGTDPGYKDAEYAYKPQTREGETWIAPVPILMGPGFKA